MLTELAHLIESGPRPVAIPIAAYVGLELVGRCVRDAVTDPDVQVAAVLALRDRLECPVIFTAMDLSAEAEAFGCQVRMAADEVPSVIGRRATTPDQVEALPVPRPGEGRTRVYLEAAKALVAGSRGVPVVGDMIGPFSLAARIFGVSEALEATIAEPNTLLRLIEKVTPFLVEYALAFRATGAAGVLLAEPAAGLLSPAGMVRFSNPFVKQVVDAVQQRSFAVILHNCGAKLVHMERMLETGVEIYHLGGPMDLPAALRQVKGRAILCGNLDPTAVFGSGSPETVFAATKGLIRAAAGHPAFALSSGCDLPVGTPIENLEAFCRAAREA